MGALCPSQSGTKGTCFRGLGAGGGSGGGVPHTEDLNTYSGKIVSLLLSGV